MSTADDKDQVVASLLEQLKQAHLALAECELQLLSVGLVVDPRVLPRFVSVEERGLVAPDGHLDKTKGAEVLDQLLAEFPYLAASSHPGIRFMGRA